MPILTLTTNVPSSKVTQEILESISKLLANIFGVTEKNVLITIKSDVAMLWGNQLGYYGLGTIQNEDGIEPEMTKALAPPIFDFIEQHLEIPQGRVYISFIKLNPSNIAVKGRILSKNFKRTFD